MDSRVIMELFIYLAGINFFMSVFLLLLYNLCLADYINGGLLFFLGAITTTITIRQFKLSKLLGPLIRRQYKDNKNRIK